MAKRGLKKKVEGRERNMLCPCGSGVKYKKCCWSGKGAGTAGRVNTKKQHPTTVITDEDIVQFNSLMGRFLMRGKRGW